MVIDYGWLVALAGDDGDEFIGGIRGQAGEPEGDGVLGEVDFLTGFEELGGEDFGADTAYGYGGGRLEEGEPLCCGCV